MFELTALAVTAVSQFQKTRWLRPDQAVEVTWRHYGYDPESVWFLDVRLLDEHGTARLVTFEGPRLAS